MCILIKEVRGKNPRHKVIYTQVDRIISQVYNRIFDLLVYLYVGLIKVLLIVMCLSCICGNVLLDKSLE